MYDPAAYDLWKTTPPEYDTFSVRCDACDCEYEDEDYGILCPDCEQGTLEIIEPALPCFCSGHCYC